MAKAESSEIKKPFWKKAIKPAIFIALGILIAFPLFSMSYFTMVSLDEYGGDDGLTIYLRSEVPFLDMEDNLVLFLVCYVSLIAVLMLVNRLVHSRFGMVIRGSKSNDVRMQAIGYNTYFYRLTAYVIAVHRTYSRVLLTEVVSVAERRIQQHVRCHSAVLVELIVAGLRVRFSFELLEQRLTLNDSIAFEVQLQIQFASAGT